MKKHQEYQGLYDPAYDHDACGVGIVANLNGRKTHDIIRRAVEVLINLEHRGACGCDPGTGDGAGILFQIPDAFFRRHCRPMGISLPDAGRYGVGMVFLPRETEHHDWCEQVIEKTVRDEGQEFLGWRDVPADFTQCGELAAQVAPLIRQFFIGAGPETATQDQFERKLYVVRKVIENAVDAGLAAAVRDDFYISSLSSKTVVYKGLLRADQLDSFYRDLSDDSIVSCLALVHSRYSTNTLGSWRLAHPYRMLCHNGEINTIRGNQNWMRAREALFSSPLFGDDMAKLSPIIREGASDTAGFDNALELLVSTGRSLPHALMMMIPEAWENHETMSDEKKAFYAYHACLMEPWDGPALIAACDGDRVCTTLDRNGLRPFRYVVTDDDFIVGASEAGVLDLPPERILVRGRLQPGRLLLVDTLEGRIIADDEIKHEISARRPYRQWLRQEMVTLDDLPEPEDVPGFDKDTLSRTPASRTAITLRGPRHGLHRSHDQGCAERSRSTRWAMTSPLAVPSQPYPQPPLPLTSSSSSHRSPTRRSTPIREWTVMTALRTSGLGREQQPPRGNSRRTAAHPATRVRPILFEQRTRSHQEPRGPPGASRRRPCRRSIPRWNPLR